MGTVSFYRFAAAIMQLLEPERYNYKSSAQSQTNASGSSEQASANNAEAIAAADATFSDDETNAATSVESEAKTVIIVAEHLTQAIANASSERIVGVAKVIQAAAAETVALTQQPTALTEKIGGVQPDESVAAAAIIVHSAVEIIAAQTTEEIRQAQTAAPETAAAPVPEEIPQPLKTQATETITNAITDKIKEKIELAQSGQTPGAAESAASLSNAAAPTSLKDAADFWQMFPELDASEIKYYATVSYLYDYMASRSLLDVLNPAINLNERYGLMQMITSKAGQKYDWDASNEREIKKDADDLNEKLRENERRMREVEARKQEELQDWQRAEHQKLAERIAAERLKKLK